MKWVLERSEYLWLTMMTDTSYVLMKTYVITCTADFRGNDQ
jgi:hypothetical protein